MWNWWPRGARGRAGLPVEERVRAKYNSFRELLSLNNECLELMAGLQEDLLYVPPYPEIIGSRLAPIFDKIRAVVGSLERLTGIVRPALALAIDSAQSEIGRHLAALQEIRTPRLSARLSEVGLAEAGEVGSKAAFLGEIRKSIGLPVPDGYVLTTEAYRQFCGIPLWRSLRDLTHNLDLEDLAAVRRVSEQLQQMVMDLPLPRAVEVALTERAKTLYGRSLAVRSSAVGEGGLRTHAGQFLTLLNVQPEHVVDAYRQVIAARFAERALFYRLSSGIAEIDSPMAVLILPVIPAWSAGIMYTRDPNDPKSRSLWITSTRGLGLEIASGRMPADLFVVSRRRPYSVIENNIVHKEAELVPEAKGGVAFRSLRASSADEPSLPARHAATLAEWGVLLEERLGGPQDVEWVLDMDGRLWILQSRPLIIGERVKPKSKAPSDALVSGGRTIYPGHASGNAYVISDEESIRAAPNGVIVLVRRPSPEIVEIFPRIAGLVAEWGNVAGHAAALLREFKIPSVFLMPGIFDKVRNGDPVSLDAVQNKLFAGTLWPNRRPGAAVRERFGERTADPISRHLLALNLLDPAAHNFRPSGCESAHDVLRYCHETAVEAMFAVGDISLEDARGSSRELETPAPLNLRVLDLGGGLAPHTANSRKVKPEEIVSRPFRSFWKGITHPGVSWQREMPASLGDLASVLAESLKPQHYPIRALGEKSYLLVAGEYMNLNARLAYHFSLVDACLSDVPAKNYIALRFEGGGSARERRRLRACFIEECLAANGFSADRRGDLVNAWFKGAPADQTSHCLDILGRLLASSSQLDMYMESTSTMKWFVRQFLAGNYSFHMTEDNQQPAARAANP